MNKSAKEQYMPRQPMEMKKQVIGDHMIPIAGKRVAVHSKDPYFIRKANPFAKVKKTEKELDGFLILDITGCALSHEVIFLKAINKNIVSVNERELSYFVNMTELDLSENALRDLNGLHVLKQLTKLWMQNNRIEIITFSPERSLENLQILDLSYNKIQHDTIKNLFYLPSLKSLFLAGNDLAELPYDLSHFKSLEELDLHANRFRSDTFATRFWFSLSTIPKLKILSVGRNQLRGIHTEKLKAGDFGNLERLDFSYNIAENQHNLICARNFKNLKVLIVTGNPFAVVKQHKGLEMEIYTRIGAVLINEDIGLPYLRKKRENERPPIQFSNLYTLRPDNFGRENRPTFFGVELPKKSEIGKDINEGGSISPPSDFDNEAEEEEDQLEMENAEKFFLTENQNPAKNKQGEFNEENMGAVDEEQTGERVHNNDEFEDQGELEDDMFDQRGQMTNIDFAAIKNIDDFKMQAGKMMGDTKEYDAPIDLQQAYKILKNLVHKQTLSKVDIRGDTLSKLKYNKKNAPKIGKQIRKKEATLMDVELLIDNLHKKITNEVHGRP